MEKTQQKNVPHTLTKERNCFGTPKIQTMPEELKIGHKQQGLRLAIAGSV